MDSFSLPKVSRVYCTLCICKYAMYVASENERCGPLAALGPVSSFALQEKTKGLSREGRRRFWCAHTPLFDTFLFVFSFGVAVMRFRLCEGRPGRCTIGQEALLGKQTSRIGLCWPCSARFVCLSFLFVCGVRWHRCCLRFRPSCLIH